MWYVYIAECVDTSLYTGVTTDLNRRIKEHNSSSRGAKYTRSRRPVRLVYSAQCKNRSDACTEEARIKSMTRSEKLKLIKKL